MTACVEVLLRFAKILPSIRLETRALTYSLILHYQPDALIQSFPVQWLTTLLQHLANLQSLTARSYPWIDHKACITLRDSLHPNDQFPLRLLDVAECPNILSSGLGILAASLPGLVYLDLSNTKVGTEDAFPATLLPLRELRVLKLRGAGLNDGRFAELAAVVRTRLRSLDVSRNALTDRAVESLAAHCIVDLTLSSTSRHASLVYGRTYYNSDTNVDAFDAALYRILTTGFVGPLELDGASDAAGLQHLDVSDCSLSLDGISRLLRLQGLHRLDAGFAIRPIPSGNWDQALSEAVMNSFRHLTYLRIPSSMVSNLRDQSRPLNPAQRSMTQYKSVTDPADPPPTNPTRPSNAAFPTSRLQKLVLTQVPPHTSSRAVIDAICTLITRFAHADGLARLDYTLPPGITTASVEVLVLEMMPKTSESNMSRIGTAASITQDEDAAAFHAASRDDFSFFDEGERHATPSKTRSVKQDMKLVGTRHDVIAEIVAFRRATKERAFAGDESSGHWSGRVEVRYPTNAG